MNAVEIEQALSDLAQQELVPADFPFQFLAAFGNKATTIARLRKGDSNASDLPGGVLQRNQIHIVLAEPGNVRQTLTALKASPKTAQAKAKFILATDGTTLEAGELATGDAIACDFLKFPDHFREGCQRQFPIASSPDAPPEVSLTPFLRACQPPKTATSARCCRTHGSPVADRVVVPCGA